MEFPGAIVVCLVKVAVFLVETANHEHDLKCFGERISGRVELGEQSPEVGFILIGSLVALGVVVKEIKEKLGNVLFGGARISFLQSGKLLEPLACVLVSCVAEHGESIALDDREQGVVEVGGCN